jgi:hypothetical protein
MDPEKREQRWEIGHTFRLILLVVKAGVMKLGSDQGN